MFDLNNLRIINNNLGHDKGDEYIRSFAEQLRLAVDPENFVGRDEEMNSSRYFKRLTIRRCGKP
mgnify:CR=1 FL=1